MMSSTSSSSSTSKTTSLGPACVVYYNSTDQELKRLAHLQLRPTLLAADKDSVSGEAQASSPHAARVRLADARV